MHSLCKIGISRQLLVFVHFLIFARSGLLVSEVAQEIKQINSLCQDPENNIPLSREYFPITNTSTFAETFNFASFAIGITKAFNSVTIPILKADNKNFATNISNIEG